VFNEFDVIIDGSDNFATRYLINDGCVLLNKPFVFGSLYKFSGQVSVFNFVSANGSQGTTYRSVFPEPPGAGTVANCSEVGVLGSVAGIIGTIQATEAIKLIVGIHEGLCGHLLMVDGQSMTFTKWVIPATYVRDSKTPKSWDELHAFDYEHFCNAIPMKRTIAPADLEKLLPLEKAIQIIDVREEWESEETPFLNAIRIPLHTLSEGSKQLNPLIKTVVICQNGNRSQLAINILKESGFTETFSLGGGISNWETQTAKVKL
jgi:adenylyltransferase/sulfurtransferase